MGSNILVALINNAALLVVFSLIYEVVYLLPSRFRRMQPVLSGLFISLICTAVMSMPFILQPGIVFDTRSILISVTALIFGLVPTSIVVAVAVIARLSLGGLGTLPGLAVIITSALIGLIWRRWVYPKSTKWSWLNIFAMSICVHVIMLVCMLLLPYPNSWNVIRAITLPVMVIYPAVTALLSLLLMRQKALRRAQDQLKQSEEKFKLLFDKAPLGYQSLDFESHFIDVNQQWCDLLGYSRNEVIGKWFCDFLSPANREIFLQRFSIFKAQGHVHSEFEMLHKNGIPLFISFEGKIGYGFDGEFKQTHCILQDITDRKKAEQALIHSHDLMRYIIEHNRSAVAVHDRDLKYLYVSQRYLDDYKIKEQDIIGKHHYEVFPDLPQRWRDVHQKVLQGEIISKDKDVYIKEDGSIEWTRWECRPWYEYDRSIGGIIVYTEVITENVKLLEDLKDKEYNLRLAQEIAHVGSFYYDPVHEKLTCSNEGLNICGITKKEFSGKIEEIIQLVHPDDREQALDVTLETVSKRKIMRAELRILRQDGETRIVDFRKQTILDENGNYVGTTGTIQDITERKKAEENLIYLNNHDTLTGLYNRRFFEEEIKKLDVKENLPISIIMADTNGLKIINDSFGHDMGDELLRKAAYVLKQACRAKDLVVRYGGDEFVIVLPKANNDETLSIANSIKELTIKEKVANIELSISYGYATKYSSHESIMEILANAENHMYSQKLSERSSMRSKTTEIIMNTLFEKSHRESQHSIRVSKLCEQISVKMKLEKQEVNKIRIAGLVHDIGKIGVDEKILNKNGKLDSDERNEIEKHAEAGWRILSSSSEFAELAKCVLHHHERWDGNGYPRKIKGENIPIEARIIAVADSFDAMTSIRSYKAAMSHEEAIKEILRCSGTQFDPAIVDVFVNRVFMKAEGT